MPPGWPGGPVAPPPSGGGTDPDSDPEGAGKPTTEYWNLDRIDQRTGRNGKYGTSLDGSGVHVYVLDTGINTEHVDFEGRAIPTIETHIDGSLNICDPKKHFMRKGQ